MHPLLLSLSRRIRRGTELARLVLAARRVAGDSHPGTTSRPILFFNATTRLSGLSQNAGFSLLASWAVRLAGIPVVHFVCNHGMSRCVLGTDETSPDKPMPCGMCVRQSQITFSGAQKRWFGFHRDPHLAGALQDLNLGELLEYTREIPASWMPDSRKPVVLPLGSLVLPSLRWRMRLQTLVDDQATRALCREFMLSAWNIAREFIAFLAEIKPGTAVLFNGTHFPEATAAFLCRQKGIRVITHESGFQPFSGYFVEGQATMYPIVIPDVELTSAQDARLDQDLQRRWQGDFSMAGVRFWNQINGLPESLRQKANRFEQVVSIFTNVIFDTTQMYANAIFPDMFAWLDELVEIIRKYPGTLFILRAHPDEARPGKASQESVAMWFEHKASSLANMAFIPPQEQINSYDLVRLSKFVLIYNSTIGLESTLLGVPVLAAGQAPFIAFDTVFFEATREGYLTRLERWLTGGEVKVLSEMQRNTRRFLYYRTYRYSLPFGEFLEATQPTGYVRLKKFTTRQLTNSPTSAALLGGLTQGKRFELDV